MPISGWMDNKNVLFSHKKGGYPAICYSVVGPWARYSKRDMSDREKRVQ